MKPRQMPTGLKALSAILENKQSPIDIREIAYQFMRQVGGPAGFVRKIMEEYDEAEVGSLARSRILDIMIRLFQIATPKERFGDVNHMTDDDLARAFKEAVGVKEAVNGYPTEICI